MSATRSCVCRRSARRIRPTRLVGYTNSGRSASEITVICQLSRNITASVGITVSTLLAIDVNVPVTTSCTPLTSLVTREITSPERVRVKKPIPIRWRCEYISVRRSRMTP